MPTFYITYKNKSKMKFAYSVSGINIEYKVTYCGF